MAQNSRPAFRSPSLEQETVEELSRRLLEITAQLNASNRSLQHLQQERTEMLANLSHDLRAPLTAIRSAVDYLTSGQSLSAQDIEGALTLIDHRTATLEHLIRDMYELFTLEDPSHAFSFSGTGCPGLSGRIFLYRTSGQPLCRSSSLFICTAGSPCHPFCRFRKTGTDSGQSARQCRKICSRRNENHSVCRAFR